MPLFLIKLAENKVCVLRGPAFEGGHCEQSHHGHEDVVKVIIAVEPQAFVDGGLVHVSILVQDVSAPVTKRHHAASRVRRIRVKSRC